MHRTAYLAPDPGQVPFSLTPDLLGFRGRLRARLETANDRHPTLDYDKLFLLCPQRGRDVWINHVAPAWACGAITDFERSLSSVGMRAGKTIPWVVAYGYAFGIACHSLAGASPVRRHEAGVISGLNMLLLALLDRLIDEHPQEFVLIQDCFTRASIEDWVLNRNPPKPPARDVAPVAAGLIELYRIYLEFGYQLLDQSPEKEAGRDLWLEALLSAHQAESASLARKISMRRPTHEMVMECAQPSVAGAWVVAVSSCLSEPRAIIASIAPFAESYGLLTWRVDDITDIQKDVSNDIWNGFCASVALAEAEGRERDTVLGYYEAHCLDGVERLYRTASKFKWDETDSFSIADILWAYVWAWLGGQARWFELSQD